jgi:purine-cytosine permease-like protein
MTAAIIDPQWAAAFDASNIGGLLAMCLQSSGGFGKVCLIILAFTIVTSIIPNNYSIGLSVQALGNWAIKIPRFLWTLAAVLVYVIAAVAGREHFATILDSFLNCLAYWSTPYALIIFQEHLIFKRGEYNLDSWNDKRGLPLGIAAFASWSGAIIVAVMSMSQNWYVGPIALAVGGAPHGADIGFELSAAACLLLYPPLRYLEKRCLEKNRPPVDTVAEK